MKLPFDHFACPWMLCLLAIPIVMLIFLNRYRNTAAVSFPKIWGAMKKSLRSRFVRIPDILRILALILIVVAIARPQTSQKAEEVIGNGTDIVICLDTSPSMRALDFDMQDRLTVAKEVIEAFIGGRKHDRIGLVVFSGVALSICPLTSDHDALLSMIPHITTEITGSDGTAIGDAIAVSANRLKNSRAKSKVIILVTDGRSNMGELDPVSAARLAKALDIKIYTVGVAKKGPSKIPEKVFGRIRYLTIREDLDEETLSAIAETTSALYRRAEDQDSLKDIFQEINRLEKTDFKIRTEVTYGETYNSLLWPALLLLLAEFLLRATVLRRIP